MAIKKQPGRNGRAGRGVDAFGAQAYDPSENVKDLSEAANKRQDDLREANDKLHASEIRRVDAAFAHLKELVVTLESHGKELRAAEAGRLDSIRQVDVTAVRTEATRALEAIQTLAATSARDAETLRSTVVTSASNLQSTTAETFKQVTDRIAALEKSSYEGVGKSRLVDPQMVELIAEMKVMREAKAGSSGQSQGIDKTWALIGAVVLIAIAAGGLFLSVNNRAPTAPVAPQVVYVPAPAAPPAVAPSAPSAPSAAAAPIVPPPVVSAPVTVVPPPR